MPGIVRNAAAAVASLFRWAHGKAFKPLRHCGDVSQARATGGSKSSRVVFLDGKYYRGNALPDWLTLEEFLFTHTLHYGGGAFEGGRCYPNRKKPGVLNVIGLDLRVERLFGSLEYIWLRPPAGAPLWDRFSKSHPAVARKYAEFFQSTGQKVAARPAEGLTFTKAEAREAILNTILLNVASGNISPDTGGDFRPLAWVGARADRSLGVFSLHHPKHFMVAAIPWGKYLGELEFQRGAPVLVAETGNAEFNRHHKLVSNYATGQRAVNTAKSNHFSEMLLTDTSSKRHLLEGTGENLLFYEGKGRWISPKQEGHPILPGKTLWTLTRILDAQGAKVAFRDVPLDELLAGKFRGVAMTGTAAELTPICLVFDSKTDRCVELDVPEEMKQLQRTYLDLVQGLDLPDALKGLQKQLVTEVRWEGHEGLLRQLDGEPLQHPA